MNLYRSLMRSGSSLSLTDWANYFTFNGVGYPAGMTTTLGGNKQQEPGADFTSYVQSIYKSNGVVFACMLARQLLFSEARFQFRRLENGRPGDLFGTPALARLEKPWPNGTTSDLLTRAIQDADLCGNFYAADRGPRGIRRLRPDWMTIIRGGPDDDPDGIDAELVGYLYHPGGHRSGKDPIVLFPEEVAHFAPIPDPEASHRGMSWLTPVLREIMADGAATQHKLRFFENGATPNVVVNFGEQVKKEQFDKWVSAFRNEHEGLDKAYKTLYLGGGADAKVIGADMKQIDFKVTQGHGETRVAAAAGVPPVIVGLSEGLEAATYSNYGQARRRFADGTMRPLWRNMAGSLASIIPVPRGAELWYDDRDIPFLREDEKDAADIHQVNATSIKTLVEAGYTPESVVAAVMAGDLNKLKHTGFFSVQLQPPGSIPGNTDGGGQDDAAGRALRALLP